MKHIGSVASNVGESHTLVVSGLSANKMDLRFSAGGDTLISQVRNPCSMRVTRLRWCRAGTSLYHHSLSPCLPFRLAPPVLRLGLSLVTEKLVCLLSKSTLPCSICWQLHYRVILSLCSPSSCFLKSIDWSLSGKRWRVILDLSPHSSPGLTRFFTTLWFSNTFTDYSFITSCFDSWIQWIKLS